MGAYLGQQKSEFLGALRTGPKLQPTPGIAIDLDERNRQKEESRIEQEGYLLERQKTQKRRAVALQLAKDKARIETERKQAEEARRKAREKAERLAREKAESEEIEPPVSPTNTTPVPAVAQAGFGWDLLQILQGVDPLYYYVGGSVLFGAILIATLNN